jgi:DNA-binding SARP family transcriptional activator/tetratricopeptide (TPR) repeat protein
MTDAFVRQAAGTMSLGWAVAEFRLLGPVEVWAAGRVVNTGPPRQRSVLAALLVDAGRPVTWESLVDRVWGSTPPEGARHALHTHIARLRRVLADVGDQPVPLVHRSGGYLLDVEPDLVDVHRFRRLVDGARDPQLAGDTRLARLRDAMALWRGEPLAGVSGEWAARVRDGWRGQHVDAAVLWARAELAAGNPGPVIGPLTDLLAENPLVEPLSGELMRALHAAGRTAEALECYAQTRRRLVEELGAEPGAELQAVHRAVLRNAGEEPAVAPVPPPRVPPTAPRAIPAQLPLDVPAFTGRTAELAQLDAALAAGDEQPTAVVISALLGTPGVGKTALAVHWAHAVAARFPDGQLYVNLRGFDPAGTQLDPAEAVRGFLDALGVPAARIPAGLAEQAALYRSVLAGRRVLVVLDNARDADQVRPLLPGAPGCLVVVTSRSRLTSLVAVEGAHPVPLDLLPTADARQLLVRRLGAARVAIEPAAVEDIIRLCARLPLALALVAARAATHPEFPLRALAAELRDAGGGLDALTGGDAATDVRAVFSWSYAALGEPGAELFRLLGLHPGPDLSVAAAASLAAVPVSRARVLLGELSRAHLLAEQMPGRFSAHDLLRAYAAELADLVDDEPGRRAATDRALGHYLHTAYAAALLLQPHRDSFPLPPPPSGVTPEPLADHERAMDWFRAEHQVLLAMIRLAARTGRDAEVWQLVWTMETFLQRQRHPHDLAAAQTLALEAARRLGDRSREAAAHRGLARAYAELGHYRDAQSHFRRALEVYEEIRETTGAARTHLEFAHVLEAQGSYQDALVHAEQALSTYEQVDHKAGRAYALNAVGWYHAQVGDAAKARASCEAALELHRDLGDRYGEAAALDSLGYAAHLVGRHREAIDAFERSVGLVRSLGDRYYEAVVLTHLGDAEHAAGRPDAAGQAWRQALVIFEDIDHPDAGQVRANLRELAPGQDSPPELSPA